MFKVFDFNTANPFCWGRSFYVFMGGCAFWRAREEESVCMSKASLVHDTLYLHSPPFKVELHLSLPRGEV